MHGHYELLEGVMGMASTHRSLLHSMNEIDTLYVKQFVARWLNDAKGARGMGNSCKRNRITCLHPPIISYWDETTGRRHTLLRQINQVSENSRKNLWIKVPDIRFALAHRSNPVKRD